MQYTIWAQGIIKNSHGKFMNSVKKEILNSAETYTRLSTQLKSVFPICNICMHFMALNPSVITICNNFTVSS